MTNRWDAAAAVVQFRQGSSATSVPAYVRSARYDGPVPGSLG